MLAPRLQGRVPPLRNVFFLSTFSRFPLLPELLLAALPSLCDVSWVTLVAFPASCRISLSLISQTSVMATTVHNDVELAYKEDERTAGEEEALLASSSKHQTTREDPSTSVRPSRLQQIVIPACSFVAGVLSILLVQRALGWACSSPLPTSTSHSIPTRLPDKPDLNFAPPYIGSTEVHHYPPSSPTNAFPSLFPTKVGFPGPTGTGAEPALLATAPVYPLQVPPPNLINANADGNRNEEFDIFKYWGNLSPWYSVEKGAFGIEKGPETPGHCEITGVHILHRHGARYPTQWCKLFTLCIDLTSYLNCLSRSCVRLSSLVRNEAGPSQRTQTAQVQRLPLLPQHMDVQARLRCPYALRPPTTVLSRCLRPPPIRPPPRIVQHHSARHPYRVARPDACVGDELCFGLLWMAVRWEDANERDGGEPRVQ